MDRDQVIAVGLSLGLAGVAPAALIDRDSFLDANSGININLIYDTPRTSPAWEMPIGRRRQALTRMG